MGGGGIPSLISLMVSVDVKHHVYLLKGGGGGGRVPMSSSSVHSDPQRPKRPSDTARTPILRKTGTPPVRNNLYTDKLFFEEKQMLVLRVVHRSTR